MLSKIVYAMVLKSVYNVMVRDCDIVVKEWKLECILRVRILASGEVLIVVVQTPVTVMRQVFDSRE
jgi:hypothetical protein